MDLDAYQRLAARTVNPSLAGDDRLVDAAAGLAEEAGEVLGLVRKRVYVGHPPDRARAVEELGDALWCLAAVATALGVPLSEVAQANVAKLQRRHPDGFATDGSPGRRDA